MDKVNSTGSIQFRYIMLPEFILQDETISNGAKLLFGITVALSSREGYCFCTNSHLSGILRKSTRSITRLIGELKDRSYITVENAAAENGEIPERRIRPDISNPAVRSFLGWHRNFCQGGTDKTVSRRGDKTGGYNNINVLNHCCPINRTGTL
ncbi:MAG: helix-turn-helix domain-containing protein [Treponema sp.]|nr:helix-turn-helix domain-containing protein [Treponema sp.]